MYVLVLQGLFDRTVKANGRRTKDTKETSRAFSTQFRETNRSEKFGSAIELNLLENSENLQT